jgi:hypothetical protein
MRWSVGSTRNLCIFAALALAAYGAIHLVRTQPSTRFGFPVRADDIVPPTRAWVDLDFKEFHPADNQLTGAVSVELVPRSQDIPPQQYAQWAAATKSVLLRFYGGDIQKSVFQGGSDAPIPVAMPPAWGSLMGKGVFTWDAIATFGPFFYPFDRYTLTANPALMDVTNAEVYPDLPIEDVKADFGNINFSPRLHRLSSGDTRYHPHLYEISLERPALLRLLAIVVGALLLVWLGYLVFVAKPEEYAGNIVTLFVGVFSIRSSLLSGAPVFPSLIDYCAVGVYVSAALIVLIKWLVPDKKSGECTFCKSSIPLAAHVCPQCTRDLPQPAASKRSLQTSPGPPTQSPSSQ